MTWDRLLYFPIRKEGILKDFLTLRKNPKASVGFEPVILGTTVQHANHCATEASNSMVEHEKKAINQAMGCSDVSKLDIID